MIKRFVSLCEITDSMFPETRKLAHLGIQVILRAVTLSDTNMRRPKKVFRHRYHSQHAPTISPSSALHRISLIGLHGTSLAKHDFIHAHLLSIVNIQKSVPPFRLLLRPF